MFSVLRRYSDFLWLYETLSINNPGVVVPPVPEKSPFGRFDDQFVQQRRSALENCINKIANHPVLCKDTDLKLFLESDTFSLDVCFACAVAKDSDLSSNRSSIAKRNLRMKGAA
jgi:sorting nexin-1/2